jgi:rod shape determining protein RodA
MDLPILFFALALSIFGFFMIRSAGAGEEAWHLRQLRFYGLGIAACIPLILIPYPRILKWGIPLFCAGLFLLLLVLEFGTLRNFSRRWFIFGGVNIQPSEIMKLGVVVYLARVLRHVPRVNKSSVWMVPLGFAFLPVLLILKQPDLGTSLIFVPVALGMVYLAGAPGKHVLLVILALGLLAIFAYHFVLRDYQRERIWSTYRQSDLTAAQRAGSGFQLTRSLAMVANGGLLGQGYNAGPMTQSGGLPEQHNDFIFAPVAEELGFLGAAVLLSLCAGLFFSILRVAATTRDPEGRLLCAGVAAFYGVQSLVEISVTLGLAPTTGMPMPLVSYGGSSYLASLLSLALVQNVVVHRALVQSHR